MVDRDFVNYWLGARLALSGEHALLFQQDAYFARFEDIFGTGYQIRSWSYPPHALLLLWPIGFLEYKTALVGFLVVTFALFVAAAAAFRSRFAPDSDRKLLVMACFGYVLMTCVAAQNGFLTAALLLLGLAQMKNRPVIAGIAFACLTIKPQLGILIPLLLALDRNWRALGWSAAFTAVLVVASAALFGIASWSAFFGETLAYQRYVMTYWEGDFLRMMLMVFGSLRSIGIAPSAALAAQIPVSIGAAALVVWLLWRERGELQRAFAILCGTLLVTPYVFNYDMGALTVCAAVLAGSRREEDSRWAVPVALVAALAGAVAIGRTSLPIAPAILAFGLFAAVWATRAANAAPARGRPASASR